MKRAKASKSGKKAAVRRPGAPVKRSTVSAPIALSTTVTSGKPKVSPTATGGTRVRHREIVRTVTFGPAMDNAFMLDRLNSAVPGYDGSPACSNLFPWLSVMADNYERFHFNKLKFTLISSLPTTAAGRVYLAWDYDYDDPAATTKASLMANRTAIESGVWSDLSLEIDCQEGHRDLKWKYCSNAKRVEPEPRTSNIGYLQIACQVVPSVTYMWDLWVEYDVEFDIPCLEEELPVSMSSEPVPVTIGGITKPISAGGAARIIDHLLPLAAGALRLVNTGTGTTPALPTEYTILSGVGDIITQAFDVQHAKPHTVLQTGIDWATDDVAPSTYIASKQPTVNYAVYDSLGEYLGDALAAIGDGLKTISGAASAAGMNTSGQQVRTTGELIIGNLIAKLPTARYLVAFLQTITAVASAGNYKPSYFYA